MSGWGSSRATSSYVSKLDLTLCQPKLEKSYSYTTQSAYKDHCCVGTRSDLDDSLSSVLHANNERFTKGCATKPGEFSGVHCSRLDITLEQKGGRKNPVCICSSSANKPHMPWRYSSSCSNSQGSQHCRGQGGFVHDHGCGFTNSVPKKQSSVTIQSTSRSSSADEPIQPAESQFLMSKNQSSWASRLDVVLASNSVVSEAQIGKPRTIFTSSSEQPSKGYAKNVTHMSNIEGVKMYISSCSLTVQPLQPKCQGGSLGQPVLIMPQGENSSKEYSVGFQMPPKGFIVSEAPTLQITQFQLTRTPANSPSIQQTSTREIWMSPERLPKVSGSAGTPEMVPNVLLFQKGCSPGCKTNLYPVIIPTQHKASKVTLVIGSPVAPVPVQVIHEYNRSPTPAIYISNGDQAANPEDLGSGFLLSVNPIAYSRPRNIDAQRPSSLLGTHPVRCKPAEPYLCHTSPCTLMPRIQNSVPINISIEAFGSRRGAVKISISHSRDLSNIGMGY